MTMSGKDFLKSHVLSWRQKVYSDWEDVTSSGRAFQVFGPASSECTNLDAVSQMKTCKTHGRDRAYPGHQTVPSPPRLMRTDAA